MVNKKKNLFEEWKTDCYSVNKIKKYITHNNNGTHDRYRKLSLWHIPHQNKDDDDDDVAEWWQSKLMPIRS